MRVVSGERPGGQSRAAWSQLTRNAARAFGHEPLLVLVFPCKVGPSASLTVATGVTQRLLLIHPNPAHLLDVPSHAACPIGDRRGFTVSGRGYSVLHALPFTSPLDKQAQTQAFAGHHTYMVMRNEMEVSTPKPKLSATML